jgi:hypothetical protein
VKRFLTGLCATAALLAAAAQVHAACGDLNNDGSRTLADLNILADCADGTCPGTISPGPLCGTGNLIDCADIFGDNDVSVGAALTADLGALGQSLAGLTPVYDLCEGPGAEIACGGGTVTFGSPAPRTITASETWPADCIVKLGGTVFVSTPMGGPTTVLKIESGSTVKGVPGTTTANPAVLIVLPGARVDWQGTQTAPIVFTSDAAVGSRNKGDWGGVMINGRGPVNGPDCFFTTEGLATPFGGCIANDNSGIATFIRVEFAGLDFTANSELNLFTMNGIGSQTQFNFIHANNGDDDCHEWFGGTINQKNLVASACGDDAFDWQLGYTGSLQFGLYIQNGNETDTGRDSRGIEADNSEFDNAASPRSDPDMCNLTLIGGDRQMPQNDGSDSGVLLRRGTRGQLANLIVTAFDDNGTELRDVSTTQQACTDGNADGVPEALTNNTVIRNSVFFDNGGSPGGTEHPKDNDTTLDTTAGCDLNACVAANCACDTEAWYNLLVANHNVENPCGSNAVNPGVDNQYPAIDNSLCTGAGVPYPCCTGSMTGFCRSLGDYRPDPIADPLPFACGTINPLFSNPSYIGALNPAAACTATQCDWLSKPWIDFAID